MSTTVATTSGRQPKRHPVVLDEHLNVETRLPDHIRRTIIVAPVHGQLVG